MEFKLIVNGVSGRMGRRIVALAVESGAFEIIGAIENQGHGDIGKDVGVLAGVDAVGVAISSEYPEEADVMIDFSLPIAADKVIDYCESNDVSLVMGTTGLSDGQIARLEAAAEKIAIVQATNMSVGMNTLFSLVGKVAKMLGAEYDVEIVEAHHRFKKDSPSGTALTLAENVAVETGRDWPECLVHGREGKEALREKGTIGMHAQRMGDVVGEHTVAFGTLGETVELSHRAHSRDIFARGALAAAAWLVGQKAGLYSMLDVLGLRK